MQVSIVDLGMSIRNWWAVLLRGMVGILFGIVAFVAPGISLLTLVFMFGAYALLDGVLVLAAAIRHRRAGERWALPLVHGIASMLAGAAAFVWPDITALALLAIVAAWAIFTGVLQVAAAVELRRRVRSEWLLMHLRPRSRVAWLLALAGVASIALGVLLVLFPVAGALALVLWIGAWALAFGALLVALSLRLRSLGRSLGVRPYTEDLGAHASHPGRA
jgi:uncharacterized membrane protein HdeD (DUF308 family)